MQMKCSLCPFDIKDAENQLHYLCAQLICIKICQAVNHNRLTYNINQTHYLIFSCKPNSPATLTSNQTQTQIGTQ